MSAPDNQIQQEDWDEDKCRNYIIRTLDWIPRNFEYQDGLHFIHRHLQLAFGDENGHLAAGVLEELIELDGFPPFPEALFQRWKHAYKRRKEMLELPPTPPTDTIIRPAVPTQRSLRHRRLQAQDIEPGDKASTPRLSPVPSSLGCPPESHNGPPRAIEYTSYVSRKGKKPKILAAPTIEEVQRKLDDPRFGRGGRIQKMKFIQRPVTTRTASAGGLEGHEAQTMTTPEEPKTHRVEELGTDTKMHTPLGLRSTYASLKKIAQYLRKLADKNIPSAALDQPSTQSESGSELNFQKSIGEMFRAEVANTQFDFQSHLQEMHWPAQIDIPNANFARKYRVPPGVSLPSEVLNGMRQWTVNEEEMQTLDRFWTQASQEVREVSDHGAGMAERLCRKFFHLYVELHKPPLTISLFYDTGTDFAWGNNMANRAESSPSRASAVSQASLYRNESTSGQQSTRSRGFRTRSLSTGANRSLQSKSHSPGKSSLSRYSARSHVSLEEMRNELSREQGWRGLVPNIRSPRVNLTEEDFQRGRRGYLSVDTSSRFLQVPSQEYILPRTTYREPQRVKKQNDDSGNSHLPNKTYSPAPKPVDQSDEAPTLLGHSTSVLRPVQHSNDVLSTSNLLSTDEVPYTNEVLPTKEVLFPQEVLSTDNESDTDNDYLYLSPPRQSVVRKKQEALHKLGQSQRRASITLGEFQTSHNRTISVSQDTTSGTVTASARVEIHPGDFAVGRLEDPFITSPKSHKLIPRTMLVPGKGGVMEIRPLPPSSTARSGSGCSARPERQLSRPVSVSSPTPRPRNLARTSSSKATQSSPGDLSRVLQWRDQRSKQRVMGLDGTFDDHVFDDNVWDFGNFGDIENSDVFSEFFQLPLGKDNTKLIYNSIADNGYEISICTSNIAKGNCIAVMDPDRKSASSTNSANPPPLRINKQTKQVRIAPSQQQQGENNSDKESTFFPPRTSSMRNTNALPALESVRREVAHRRKPSDATSGVPSTLSSYRGHYLSDASGGQSSAIDTTRSTVSSYKAHYVSGSSDIIGNFVPIDSQVMAPSSADSEPNGGRSNLDALGRVKAPSNPYQFEPDTPLPERRYSYQTTFTDFITDPHDSQLASSPQVFYLKKSPSAGNAFVATGRKPTPMVPLASKPGARRLQRCESSPNVSSPPQFSVQYHQRSASPDLAARFGEIVKLESPARRGRSPPPQDRRGFSYEDESTPVPSTTQRHFMESRPESPFRPRTSNEHIQSYLREPRPESPLRGPSRSGADYYGAHASTNSRYGARSPTKTLRDLVERDESYVESPELPRSPKKRSRSPMKKMFGENGWLGRSPAEAQENVRQNQKAAAAASTPRKEKVSMMGKLKTKLGEFAEKADLSPMGRSRFSNDTPAKISVLSVSLGPPEQARILMEVELMIVHTANSFLMNQFSQGRMAVDSIKKTVDAWKNRGRPTVIEFMYDQATQRDLVAINQHNFRFHGERAGDSARINSMLYTWKMVASQMAIRTFCNADTIILKLLFDIEMIIELLGARDAILLRLQQIRSAANERMRLARQQKDNENTQDNPAGRDRNWHNNSSEDGPSMRTSMDDPYGGLKLVPDSYRERH